MQRKMGTYLQTAETLKCLCRCYVHIVGAPRVTVTVYMTVWLKGEKKWQRTGAPIEALDMLFIELQASNTMDDCNDWVMGTGKSFQPVYLVTSGIFSLSLVEITLVFVQNQKHNRFYIFLHYL